MNPLLILILDGWGHSENAEHNAIKMAVTPQWNAWLANCPHALLEASGETVGLPKAQIGNSEVGHMHIGAGRVIFQDLCRINNEIENKQFFKNPVLNALCTNTKKNHGTLHIMGLFSPGGVHSHQDHLFALLELCKKNRLSKVALHLFLDGRDTPPQSALTDLAFLETKLLDYPSIKIASLCGRFYAMDRDQRWERIKETYDLLTVGNANHFNSATAAVKAAYEKGFSDEFVPPCVIGHSPLTIQDNDSIFFFNFRADRAIQLCISLIDPLFSNFTRIKFPHVAELVTMVPYTQNLPVNCAYQPQKLTNTLGEIFAKHNLSQLRIAETEKFPHVTYFFNGGIENIFPKESRLLIPSPKVKTYDLSPAMRAEELTEKIIANIIDKQHDVIIANFANADMVGHTGNLTATIEAIEILDQCFVKINAALQANNAHAIITADHGNAEVMYNNRTLQSHTAHTLSPVPFIYVGTNCQITHSHGSLIDIAPTVLYLLNIKQPIEMTGHSLLKRI